MTIKDLIALFPAAKGQRVLVLTLEVDWSIEGAPDERVWLEHGAAARWQLVSVVRDESAETRHGSPVWRYYFSKRAKS